MKYQTRFGRITNFGKLADRFLTCQVNQPLSDELSAMGNLYILVEITNPWLSAAQVGQTIINTLIRNYYKGQESSNLINFENAVKKVNEALAQITQNGETDWIGNLNAMMILNIDDEIHFTQTGELIAFLSRGKNINDLALGSDRQPDTHPLKTFSNIASGTLESGDKIVVANTQLLKFVPKDKLETLIGKHSPRYALFEAAKIIKRQKSKNINVMALEILDPESAANLALEEVPETIYLDQPLESYAVSAKKYFNNYIRPTANWIGHHARQGGAGFIKFTKTRIAPTAKKYLTKIKTKTNQTAANTRQKLSSAPHLKTEKAISAKEKIVGAPKINHYAEPKIIKLAKKFLSWIISHPKYIYGLLAIIFILVVISIISNHTGKKPTNNTTDANAAITQIDSLLKEADSLASTNKNQAASNAAQAKNLISSEQSLDASKKTAYYQQIADIFSKTINAKTLTATGEAIDLPEADQIFLVSNKITGFSLAKNSLIDFGLKKEVINKPILANEPTASRLAYYDGADTLFIETGQNHLYSYSIKNDKATQLTAKGDWVQGINFLKYGTKLYFLTSDGSIVKYNSTGTNSYSEAFQYITDKTKLTGPVSWDVDGKIYVLEKSGQVSQFNQGKKTSFALTAVPQPYDQIIDPVKVVATDNSNEIYVVDAGAKDQLGGRILVFDKNGQYKKQYLFPEEVTNLQDVIIQPQSQNVWFLSGSKVYQSQMN